MAKEITIPYDDAILAISTAKFWPAGLRFDWKSSSSRRFPAPYSFRASLALDDARTTFAEDWFVELYFKRARVPGVPDTLSITLVVNKARVVAIDDNGVGSHVNRIGAGLPFFQKPIDFPHIHFPIPESSYGYAEPVDSSTVQAYWELFLLKTNIVGAPRIELPDAGQMELTV